METDLPRRAYITSFGQGEGEAGIIDLDTPANWPTPVRTFLADHHALFLDWATVQETSTAREYDRAIYSLADLLRQYSLVAWHCTRLADHEIESIKASGMEPLSEPMLYRRIDAAIAAGLLTPDDAAMLKSKHQASQENRTKRLWFCFYPPSQSGETGIADLLDLWGGEALYNSHDRDPTLGPKLRSIGTPCLVEAEIPIAMLGNGHRPTLTVVALYLRSRGLDNADHLVFEDRITEPLPPHKVRRVIRYPDADFLHLTGCEPWASRFQI